MKILGFQTDIAWEDSHENFSRIRAMLASVYSSIEGSLMVFPELSTCGFTMNTEAVAEAGDGESMEFYATLARNNLASVIAGIAGRNEVSPLGANEAVIFSPDGGETGRYRKIHPFPLVNEGRHYPAGDSPLVVRIGEWTVAPFICYDLRFPEPFRNATAQGAEILVVIANWPAARVDHWSTLLRARAIENQAYVIGVNRAGSDPHLDYPGRSVIVGPKGEILAEAGDQPEVITAELDRDSLLSWRHDFPALSSLNPET